MATSTKVSPIMNLAGVLISSIAFAIGFWHCHLGLRSFDILSSNYGSLIASLLILLLLMLSYYSAIGGKKIAFIFYLICALFYFTFNMTSLYPNRLGRKLIKEEAIVINDSLQNFTSKINREFGKAAIIKKYNSVTNLRDLLKQEISQQSGFGPRSEHYLQQINDIIGEPYIKASIKVGDTQEERDTIANQYSELINTRLDSYVIQNVGVGQVDIIKRVNELKSIYEPEMIKIIEDNSKVDIETVRSNPQINTMQQLVTKMDNICIDANRIYAKMTKNNFTVCNNYGEVKSLDLGTFEHTINSVFNRLNKTDTWGIIIFCLFIDFIVPLGVYFMIRKRDEEDEESSVFDWILGVFGKKTSKNIHHY